MNKNIISGFLILSFSAVQAKSLVEERFEKSWSEYCGKESEYCEEGMGNNTLLGSAKKRYMDYLFGCNADAERKFFQKGDAFRGEEGVTFQKIVEISKKLEGSHPEEEYRNFDELVSAHLGVSQDEVKDLPAYKKVELVSMLCRANLRVCRIGILVRIGLSKKIDSYDDQALERFLKEYDEKTTAKLNLYRFNQSVLWKLEEFFGN